MSHIKEKQMAKDYNNPLDQIKAISYNLKRVADALEGIEEKLTSNTPKTLSDTYQFKPVSKKDSDSIHLRNFINSMGKNV